MPYLQIPEIAGVARNILGKFKDNLIFQVRTKHYIVDKFQTKYLLKGLFIKYKNYKIFKQK